MVRGAAFMFVSIALWAAMGSLRISDAARVYARRSFVDEAGIANAEDVLRIGAGLSWPTLHLELEYAPRLTVVDIFGSGSSPLLSLHSGSAGLLIRQPRYTLRLTQTGMWGEPDFTQFAAVTSAQATQAAAPMQAPAMDPMANPPTPVRGASSAPTLNLLPSARTLHMAGEETAVDLSVVLARRWRSDTRASYGFAGGADDLARMFWPRQRRAELDQAVAFDWSRRDQLSTLLSGARIEVSNGYEYWLTSASEAWDTRLSATTGSQLGVGAAFHESTAPDGTSSTHWGPIGSANLTHMTSLSEARVRLQVGLAYAPEINVLLGTLQNRLQGTASAAAVKGHVTVDLILAASQTIPTSAPYAARLASVALDLQYKLSEWLGAELGGQLIQQKLTSVIASTGGMWLLYVGIIARAPEAKF
jgi:hypothetical protein